MASNDLESQQLEFYQAMADFRSMFPDMDEEIIEAVLRANNGAVDGTIDQLLTMNCNTNSPPSMNAPPYTEEYESRDLICVQASDRPVDTVVGRVPANGAVSRVPDDGYLIGEKPRRVAAQMTASHVQNSSSGEDRGAAVSHTNWAHHHNSDFSHQMAQLSLQRAPQVQSECSDLLLLDFDIAAENRAPPDSMLSESHEQSDIQDVFNSSFESTLPAPPLPPRLSPSLPPHGSSPSRPPRGLSPSHGASPSLPPHGASPSLPPHRLSPALPPHSSSPSFPPLASSPVLPPHDKFPFRPPRVPLAPPSPTGPPLPPKKRVSSQFRSYPPSFKSLLDPTEPLRYQRQWVPALLGKLPYDFLRFDGKNLQHDLQKLAQKPGSNPQPVGRESKHHEQRPTSQKAHDGGGPAHEEPTCDCHKRRCILNTAVLQQKIAETDEHLAHHGIDGDMRQLLEDERLALLLQSEEFLSELRQNEDFMRALEHDNEVEGYGDADRSVSMNESKVKDSTEFRQRLSQIGGASKKKLIAAARQFFARCRKKCPRQILRDSSAPSTVNLLEPDEDSGTMLTQAEDKT